MKPENVGSTFGTAGLHSRNRGCPLASTVKAGVSALVLLSSALALGRIGLAGAQVPCPPALAAPPVTPAARQGPFQFFGGPRGSGRICYPEGWSLVGGPGTFPVPLWIWDPAAEQYRELPAGSQFPSGPLDESDGQGAWAYFSEPTAVMVPTFPVDASVTVPLVAGQWQQIGNPFPAAPATVCQAGALSSVFTYDPALGEYSPTTMLEEGQGAWIHSLDGGDIALIPAGTASACPPRVSLSRHTPSAVSA